MGAVSSDDEPADLVSDLHLPRPWYHALLGGTVSLTLVLTWVHPLLMLVGLGLLLALELVSGRRGHTVPNPTSSIAWRTSLAAYVPTMVWLLTMTLGVLLLSGTLVPREAIPSWAAVIVALAVGAAVAVLTWKAECLRLAAVRRLEADDDA